MSLYQILGLQLFILQHMVVTHDWPRKHCLHVVNIILWICDIATLIPNLSRNCINYDLLYM